MVALGLPNNGVRRCYRQRIVLRPLVICFALLVACAAEDTGPRMFEGWYTWESAEGALAVVFVPNGIDSWNVNFEFDYHGNVQTWTGKAWGDLRSGPVEGLVSSDNPELGYVFRGEFHDGVFEGVHAERIDGRERPGGTVRFEPAAP